MSQPRIPEDDAVPWTDLSHELEGDAVPRTDLPHEDLSHEQVGPGLRCHIDLKIDLWKLSIRVKSTNNPVIGAMVAYGLLVMLVAGNVYGANMLFATYGLPAAVALPLDASVAVLTAFLGWRADRERRSFV